MRLPKIVLNHGENNIAQYTFHIFSETPFLGKPDLFPWRDGFAVICSDKESHDFYFWLVTAFYNNGYFKPCRLLRGISRLSIEDTRLLIAELAPVALPAWRKYKELLAHLDKLQGKETKLAEQLEVTQNLQYSILKQHYGV